MNFQQQEEFYQVMTRLKANSNSRAASLPEAEIRVSEMDSNGVLVSKPLKKIEHISEATTTSEPQAQVWNLTKDGPVLQSKAASTSANQTETVVTRYFIDQGGSSTGDQIYKCGIHDYETRSMKEFNEHIALSHNDNDTGSKAASLSTKEENKLKAIHDFINGKH